MQIQFGAIRKATVDSFPNPKGHEGLGRDDSYLKKEEEFHKAVQAHLHKLAAKHSHQDDYYAIALPGRDKRTTGSLIIDGARDIKRFLMDVFIEQQKSLVGERYLPQQSASTALDWGDWGNESPAFFPPLTFLRVNKLDHQAMDRVIQRYFDKAKPLQLKPLDPTTGVVDRTTPEPM